MGLFSPSLEKTSISPVSSPRGGGCRRSSLKRFLSNNSTSKVVKEDDVVIINVDEDCAILQMVDSQLHGKMGRVLSIVGDEVELEIIVEDDFEWNGSCIVSVPIFCVCLEDRVLQSRLLS